MKDRESILNRMFVVFGLLLLVPCAIALQLLRINFWVGSELRKLWSDQTIDTISIPAKRGNIYGDKGSLLATNSVAYKVAIDPHLPGITKKQINTVSGVLADHTSQSAYYYRHKIRSAPARSRYVVLGNNVPVAVYDSLQTLNYRAVILGEKYRRKYNFGTLAAHTLGYVNYNMNGQTGLEKEYNKQLKGTDGKQQVRRDPNGNISAYIGAPKKQPKQGYSLYTTIDTHIQAILQEELKAGVKRTKSDFGTAVVMNPQTGAIKALANYPTFNPNNPSSLSKDNRRNFMISDMVEPGSTFKLVTAIAAVEKHKVNFTEKIHTPKSGEVKIHGQWMRDHKPLGTLTFPEVIQESSNIGASEIAMRLSNDTFYQYARNLGFGTPTNIDLPDEARGKLKKPYKWTKVTLPWMAIGYGVQVTPIQLAQAYAAFANNGIMMRPYIVKKIVDAEGNVVKRHKPVKVRRVAKKSTMKKLKPVFERVVSDSGTAKKAQVKGLTIAGKTGTAQELIKGRYRHIYRGLFVGFFPVHNPKYLCLVMMDKPQTWPPFGGWVAGPVFHHTAKRIAGLDNSIEQKIIHNEHKDTVWARAPDLKGLKVSEARALLHNERLSFTTKGKGSQIIAQKPAAGAVLKKGEKITLQESPPTKKDTAGASKNYAVIPKVDGMSMRKAVRLINEKGFQAKIIGSGTVYRQYPHPGDSMKKGQSVTIRGKEHSLKTLASSNK
ncbi:MAG TPA: penicillin-binding transpeptidase domain-containing protein [Balneolaceae bacterium]|nr:penicillin-binding transpeptidase domain-containing protein [Balneolaceae bacterium]